MSNYKILDQFGPNFLTLTVVDWIDVFTRKSYKDILLDSLRYCQQHKGLVIFAYVIMTNHLHLLVEAGGDIPLSDILRDFKKFTAKALLKEIQTGGYESRKEWMLHKFSYRANVATNRANHFWQYDNHPIQLYSLPVICQKVDYIHLNPVKQGWVEDPAHYLYSSAANYANRPGLLEVTVLDLPLSFIGYIPGT